MLAALSPESQINTILDDIGCVVTNYTDPLVDVQTAVYYRHSKVRMTLVLRTGNTISGWRDR